MKLDKIKDQIENNPWKTAITIRKNNQTIFQNGETSSTFKAASLIKLGIALYIQEEVPNSINDIITLSPLQSWGRWAAT